MEGCFRGIFQLTYNNKVNHSELRMHDANPFSCSSYYAQTTETGIFLSSAFSDLIDVGLVRIHIFFNLGGNYLHAV